MSEELSYEEIPPTDGEILQLVADHFDVEPECALRWLDAFDPEQAMAQYRLSLGLAI